MDYLFFNVCLFFQAEDGIRDLVRSRGLGDVYKRQGVQRGTVGRSHPRLRDHARADGLPVVTGRSPRSLSLIHI